MGDNHISHDINEVDKRKEMEGREESNQSSTKKEEVKINMRGIKSDPNDLMGIIGELQEKLKTSRRQARTYKLERDELKREKEEQGSIPSFIGDLGSVEELAKERDAMKQKAIELQSELSKLSGAKGDLEDTVEELKIQLKEYEDSTLTEDFASLQKEYDKLIINYEALRTTHGGSKPNSDIPVIDRGEQIAILTGELKNTKEEVSALTVELDNRTEALSKLGQELNETSKELAELQEIHLEYKNALNAKEQLIVELKTEKFTLSETLSSLQSKAEISATSLVSQSDLDERDKKIRFLEENIVSYQERINKLEGEVTKLQDELAQSEEKSGKLQEELESAQGELASAQGELAVTQGELSSTESKVAKLQSDLVNAQSDLAKANSEVSKINIQLDQLRNNITVAVSQEDKRKLIMHDVIKIVNDTQATVLSKHKEVEQEVLSIIQSDEVRNQLIKLNDELEKIN